MSFFASVLPALLAWLALSQPVIGQNYGGSGPQDDGFQYVQPLNTTILGQYGHSPAVLPSPNATGIGGWEQALEQAKAFVAQLTLEEKADMVTGQPGPCVGNIVAIPRLGFNGLCLQDGPLAIRVADYTSLFSAGVSIAATWDKKMMYDRGLFMGGEFKAKGAHVALAPVCGPLGRSGYGGRNWEGFAADPYFTGIAMEETIKGLQDAGVQATAKHFIGNEQETMRNPSFSANGTLGEVEFEALSANIDDRTIHELYLWPFANSVRAKVSSVMCAYQRLNGSYTCQNSKVQNGLLKGELGFQGYIMSDWGATHAGVATIEAGLDMDMPGGIGMYGMSWSAGSFFGGNVTAGVSNGTIEAGRVDDMIVRIMTPYYWLKQDSADFPTIDPSTADLNTFSPRSSWLREYNLTGESSRDVRAAGTDQLIREHGAASSVLLKNTNGTLPLKAPKLIAVFGNDAGEITEGMLNQEKYEFGTLVSGGGSGTGRISSLVSPLAAIKERARKDGAMVQQWLNNTLIASSDVRDLWIPKVPDVCIVMLKTWAAEGEDRHSLDVDWDGNRVVESVASHCPNTVVVTHSSGINHLPWADHENVTALVAAHFPGEESGNSLVDVLYGDVNPSGKLPYTIALEPEDYNAPPTTAINTTGVEDWQSWFDEKLEIDYRYFDAHNISVRYEFGFGLSYTTFDLGPEVSVKALSSSSENGDAVTAAPAQLGIQPGGNPALWESLYSVTVSVSNSGPVAGAAVPQLYVSLPGAPEGTPPRQLRGFEKVMLQPGQSSNVTFDLMRRDISYWDVVSQDWLIPEGEIRFSVGFSSRDLRSFASVSPVSAAAAKEL